MKTDDDEQAETRQEDVHEDAGEEKRAAQSGREQPKRSKKAQKQTHVRLSIQAVFPLCDGHRLVENCILENVSLNKKKTKSGPNSPETNFFFFSKETKLWEAEFSPRFITNSAQFDELRLISDTRALTLLSL